MSTNIYLPPSLGFCRQTARSPNHAQPHWSSLAAEGLAKPDSAGFSRSGSRRESHGELDQLGGYFHQILDFQSHAVTSNHLVPAKAL